MKNLELLNESEMRALDGGFFFFFCKPIIVCRPIIVCKPITISINWGFWC